MVNIPGVALYRSVAVVVLASLFSVSCSNQDAGRRLAGMSLPSLLREGKKALAERDWAGALDCADQAVKLDTGSRAAHYIAAVAYRESGAIAFREPGHSGPSIVGDWGKSRREFRWILDRDSSFEDVLYQFALLFRYEGDKEGALALSALQIAKKPDLPGPQVGRYNLFRFFMATEDSADYLGWLRGLPGDLPRYFIAETCRRRGNLPAADTLLHELLLHPGDVSIQAIRLSLARLRFKQGDPDGAETEYWKAVEDVETELGAAILFEDVKYIVSDGELDYYRSLRTVDQKREFFESFWNFRNPSMALGFNPRLREHINRFVQAEERFEYYGSRTRFNDPDRLRELVFPKAFALNDEFNDMGLIFLRQGPPDDILRKDYGPADDDPSNDPRLARYFGPLPAPISREDSGEVAEVRQRIMDDQHDLSGGHDPLESWLYRPTPESPRMIFHFQKHNAVGNNWRLTPSPASDRMTEELQMWDARYQRLYAGTESDRVPLQAQLKSESRVLVDYALSTEKQTWEKKKETFSFPHAVDEFRAPDGRSLIDVSYAIPLSSLSRGLPDTVKSIPVEIGFSLVDAGAINAVTRLDTMQVGLTRTRTGVILDLIRYTVLPDSYAVSMHLRPLGEDRLGIWHQPLRVRDFSGSEFLMSSVQYLRPSGEEAALAIDGVKVVQSPFRFQMNTEPLLVYFQLYHLVPDLNGNTAYRAECVLLPEDEKDPAKGIVVYAAEKSAKEEMAAVFCQIDVHAIDPGRYTLIVRATDRKRVQTLTAKRPLEIVKP